MTISVLVACYNAAATLGATLTSVLTQTRQADEIIVVDDGSSDHSVEVASEFAAAGVTVLTQVNAGAAAARNRAFGVSRGRLVLFLDADDLVGPQHLEALSGRLKGCELSIAQSRCDRFRVDPEEARFPSRPTDFDQPGADWLVRAWADARPMMQCGMMLIPRVLIETHGGWDERLSLIDDFEFFARLISRCDGIKFAPDARLYYRSGVVGSLSGSRSRTAVESQLLSLMLGTNHLLGVRNTADARRVCANLFQDFEYSHYPDHSDLRAKARARAAELGGASIEPDGPPRFHTLRRLVGWRLARRIERLAISHGFNGAKLGIDTGPPS